MGFGVPRFTGPRTGRHGSDARVAGGRQSLRRVTGGSSRRETESQARGARFMHG